MMDKIYYPFTKLIIFISFCLLCIHNNTNAQVTNDTSKFYLELTGRVRQMKNLTKNKGDNPWLDSAVVTIYNDTSLYSQLITNNRGRCSFKLDLNKSYKIKISKRGFVTKFIEVNTLVPKFRIASYEFEFDIDIFESIKDLDVSVLEKPIAKVMYSASENSFAYDIAYTNRINESLKKMYHNYYLLQKMDKKNLH
ncbi:MAG: hypothetical protein ABI315_05205 [Bacteroidia bacterium]